MNDKILSLLGICRRAGKMTIGADPAVESVVKGKSKLIIYANDFSVKSLKPVVLQADMNNIKVLKLNRTKEELSFALGKLCGVLSIEDKGFADKFIVLIESEQREEQ